MVKFFSTWLGAAVFTVASIGLPAAIFFLIFQVAAPSMSRDELANVMDVTTDTPIVLLVLYWPWFLSRRMKAAAAKNVNLPKP